MTSPITLVLPWPVSCNRYWRTRTVKGFAMTYVSEEAKQYKRDVAWLAKAAGLRAPLSGRVRVDIQLYPQQPQDFAKRARLNPDNWDDGVRCIDLDNARKVLYDALKGIAFEDDKWIFEDSAKRMQPDGEARVVVTISPLIITRIQPTLFEVAN